MPKSLPSLEETIEIYKLRANKSLGQHFLLDTNITDKIARLALPLDQCDDYRSRARAGRLNKISSKKSRITNCN